MMRMMVSLLRNWDVAGIAVFGILVLVLIDAPWRPAPLLVVVCDSQTDRQIYVELWDGWALPDRYDRNLNSCTA